MSQMRNKVSNAIKKNNKKTLQYSITENEVFFIVREIFTINVICKVILFYRYAVYYNVPNIDLRKLIDGLDF